MTLILGDCLEELSNLKTASVDLLFCDLPYGQTNCEWDTLIDLELFWKEVNRVCKITAPMFFTCTTRFGVSLINTNYKNFRYDLVWHKSCPCGHLNAKKMPMRDHEMIYVFYRKLPHYDITPHIPVQGREYRGACTDDKSVYGKTKRLAYRTEYDPPLPRSVITIKSEKGKHNTQKPLDLMKWIFKYYSKEGDVILDPTMGSGSTGVAALEMNRQFIGIEKDVTIYETARQRINDVYNGGEPNGELDVRHNEDTGEDKD